MIMYVTGDLFQSPAKVLVNTVNTVGVMGKGVAYEFKRLFPDMFTQYRDLCERRQFKVGMLWLYKSPNKWVLNFPTKEHWRHPSREKYIVAGLEKFIHTYADMGIHSIAFPPLGCGHGKLDFKTQIQPIMERYLRKLPIDVFIYPDRSDPFFVPEHENLGEMRSWIRSEPTNLPFAEVWDDLVQLLSGQNTFKTIANGNPFKAFITNEPHGLEIISARQHYYITYDNLLAFWQQLRTHGFSMRHIAPGISKKVYYLTPIFTSLPYIKPVRVADKYTNLQQSPTIGLQVLPVAFSRNRQPSQPSLFELA